MAKSKDTGKTGHFGGKVGDKNPPVENQFKKGQSGNPSGKPRQTTQSILDSLKEKGFTELTAWDIKKGYLMLANMQRHEVVKISNDEEAPMYLKVTAQRLLKGDGFEIIEKAFDRAVGKATQPIEQTNIEKIDLSGVSDDDLTKIMEIAEKVSTKNPKQSE